MKIFMISGADGTGKSTILNSLRECFEEDNLLVAVLWLRFNHYLARGVNFLGRVLGLSYYENYSWGKVGYHEYSGLIGYLYIFAVYIDHIIFRIFFRSKYFNSSADIVLVDRYILDIIADLIVDTRRSRLVLILFNSYCKAELLNCKSFVLDCDQQIVISRRSDIYYDFKYSKKLQAYKLLRRFYGLAVINTGNVDIEVAVHEIRK